MNCLIEIYRHVGERVRMDLGKKGLPQSRCVQMLTFNICDQLIKDCYLSPLCFVDVDFSVYFWMQRLWVMIC